MPTQKQIDANRLNALRSTGPRTPEGKARSSQNAFKSGLDADSQFVYGESREDFAQLRDEWFASHPPQSPEERFYVDTLVRNEWMLRRLFRAEAHLWEYQVTCANRSEGTPLGEALAKASDPFTRLQRRITLCERSYKEAYRELERLQARRTPPPEPPQPEAAMEETGELGSFLNSAPEPPEEAPAEPSSAVFDAQFAAASNEPVPISVPGDPHLPRRPNGHSPGARAKSNSRT